MELTGAELARRYAAEIVEPLLAQRFPRLPYAVGRLGSGSDVLGLDDPVSRDHDWGLRLTLLVEPDDVADVDALLARELPATFLGLPTRFATTWDPVDRHRTEVATPGGFALSRLGIDATRPLSVVEWLSLTGQSVLEVTAGPVFTDTLPAAAGITAIRDRLAWYPEDLWRYFVAVDWAKLAQELPLVGRAGSRGDDLGSRVVAARLVGVLLHLGFLLERRWPPYAKWIGTAFTDLPQAAAAGPHLAGALAAADWEGRQAALGKALTTLFRVQRSVDLPVPDGVSRPIEAFFERPFLAVVASVPDRLLATVVDPEVRALPRGVGSVEQWVDNVDVLTDRERRTTLTRALGLAPVEHRRPL